MEHLAIYSIRAIIPLQRALVTVERSTSNNNEFLQQSPAGD